MDWLEVRQTWRQKKYDELKNPRGPRGPWVSHTTVLPDGEEITWEFKSIHGERPYRWHNKSLFSDPFRKCPTKGVTKNKGRREDSFNRTEKTRNYRHNDKTPCRWPCGPKAWACTMQNQEDRRNVRRQIKKAMVSKDYDQIDNDVPPRDSWMWD